MEIWKDIKGFEGIYQASNLGNIKSLKRLVKHPKQGLKIVHERIMLQNAKTSYCIVTLCKTKRYNKLVHRLIAETFIENTLNKPCVNHIDGNKKNNSINNLEWVTYSENEKHSYRILGKSPNLNNNLIPTNKIVFQYDLSNNFIASYNSTEEAARELHIKWGANVAAACRGTQKTCNGFIFKYKIDLVTK